MAHKANRQIKSLDKPAIVCMDFGPHSASVLRSVCPSIAMPKTDSSIHKLMSFDNLIQRLSASTRTRIPGFISDVESEGCPFISTAGMSDIAHAEAVIMSIILVHITASGASPLTFNE